MPPRRSAGGARKAAPAGTLPPAGGWSRVHTLFLALYLGLALVQAYQAAARYKPLPRDTGDPSHYLAMTEGRPLEQELRVYRWRVLTPLAVRFLPGPPQLLAQHYQVDADKVLRFKYAVWNAAGNVAAALALLAFLQALGFGLAQAGLGGLLYLLMPVVLLDGAMPLVDAWANAAIAACLWLALRQRLGALAAAFALGLFVKETLVVVPAYLWLLRPPRLGWLLAALLPGLAAYLWFRYGLYGGGDGVQFTVGRSLDLLAEYDSLGRWAYVGGEFVLHFAVLAPLAWLGWRHSAAYPGLRRMAWLLPPLAAAPLILGTELARPWSNGFPVFLPLAVLGITGVINKELQVASTSR